EWINDHEGVAAWVQAVGVITSFSIAIYFSRQDVQRRRAKERRQAAALVPLMLPALDAFRHKIRTAEANPGETKPLELPNKVTRGAKDIQLVEGAAGFLNSLLVPVTDTVAAKFCAAARPRLSGNRNFNSRFPLFAGEAKNPKLVAVVIVTSLPPILASAHPDVVHPCNGSESVSACATPILKAATAASRSRFM